MDRFNMQNLRLDQITTPTSTKLRQIVILLNDVTIFWALQSRLVALQWTVEGYKDLAHKIMYQVTDRLLDEAGMRLYLSDMTGRGEEDGELVGIAHWLFNVAPNNPEFDRRLEMLNQPEPVDWDTREMEEASRIPWHTRSNSEKAAIRRARSFERRELEGSDEELIDYGEDELPLPEDDEME